MRGRSARISRNASISLAGLVKHRANILVSRLLTSPVLSFPSPRHLIRHSRGGDVDPYHTYLSIAAAAVVLPDPTWVLQPLDPLLNTTHETARWAKEHVAAVPSNPKG